MRALSVLLLGALAAAASEKPGIEAYGKGDHAAAFRLWKDEAERGGRKSQYHLALLYRDGEGTAKDLAGARHWLEESASRSYFPAMNELARFWNHGIGGPEDPVKAREWYEKSVREGSYAGMNRLGLLLMNGRGGPVDYPRAMRLYRDAAKSLPAAMFNVGLMYEKGRGVTADTAEAAAWYTIAAEQGEPGAEAERDRLIGAFSTDQASAYRHKVLALRSRRGLVWAWDKFRVWTWILDKALAMLWGVWFLWRYLAMRRHWKVDIDAETDRRYRDLTGSRWRRWFLWYLPWGADGWVLHGVFHLVLWGGAALAMGIVMMPWEWGTVWFLATFAAIVPATGWLVRYRDRHALSAHPDLVPGEAEAELERRYRERTGSAARRWLLWYRPWGATGWILHGWFHLLLAIAAVFLAALASMPFEAGTIPLALLIAGVLALFRQAAAYRDRRSLATSPDRNR